MTQTAAASVAGLSQSCWSDLERGRGANVSLRVWVRAGDAVGSDLRAYLERASAADQPRDAVHLRHQELIARTATTGGWQVRPEASLGDAGVADLLLTRPLELALLEAWNWFADVGEALRSWDRKLERLGARTNSAVSGCWVVRSTQRSRALVGDHRTLFTARFAGGAAEWMAALTDAGAPMPQQPGLLWVSVKGDRLFPSRGLSARR